MQNPNTSAKASKMLKIHPREKVRESLELCALGASSPLETPARGMAIPLTPPSVQWALPSTFHCPPLREWRTPLRTLASQRVGVARAQRSRSDQDWKVRDSAIQVVSAEARRH